MRESGKVIFLKDVSRSMELEDFFFLLCINKKTSLLQDFREFRSSVFQKTSGGI